MSISVILGLILFALFAASFALGAFLIARSIKSGGNERRKKGITSICVSLAFLAVFATVPFSMHQVDAGEIAVVKHFGEAKEVKEAGLHFDFWMTNKYEIYDAKVQNMEVASMAYSKDAQTMDIAMTVQYQIDPTKALQIAKQYGSMEVLANRIQSITVEKTKAVLSAYSAMNIIETRANISPEVEKAIKAAVDDEYCVNITTVVLTNIDFSAAFEKTVEDKMIAEQEKLKAEYEKETAIINAEKELEVAKRAAQAKIEEAKATAEAQVQVARAEAQAIQLKSVEIARMLGFTINESVVTDPDTGETAIEYVIDFTGKTKEEIAVITDYLKYAEYIAKWDGELPSVMTGDSASVIIPTPSV